MLVLGNGEVGKVFTHLAHERGHDVVTVDYKNGDIKADFKRLDERLLKKYDLLVNLLPSYLNESVLEWYPRNSIPYVDFSTKRVYPPTEHMVYSYKFEDVYALANVGVGPGISNLLVADLVDRGATWINMFFLEDQEWFKPLWGLSEFNANLHDPILYAERTPMGALAVKNAGNDYTIKEIRETHFGSFEFYLCFGDELLSLSNNFPNLDFIKVYAGGRAILGEIIARDIVLNGGALYPPSTDEDPPSKFSMIVESDVGSYEIAFPPSEQIHFGNPITYTTALAGLIFIEKIRSYALDLFDVSRREASEGLSSLELSRKFAITGLYYPEMLEASLRHVILSEFLHAVRPVYVSPDLLDRLKDSREN